MASSGAAAVAFIGHSPQDGTNNVRPMTRSHEPFFSPASKEKQTKRPEGRTRNARSLTEKGSQEAHKPLAFRPRKKSGSFPWSTCSWIYKSRQHLAFLVEVPDALVLIDTCSRHDSHFSALDLIFVQMPAIRVPSRRFPWPFFSPCTTRAQGNWRKKGRPTGRRCDNLRH